MRVLSVVHQRDAGPGVFAEAGGSLVEWRPREDPPPDPGGWDAAMVFGGAMNVDQEDEHPWLAAEKELIAELVHRQVPVLGVCLGSQLLAEAAGATPGRAPEPEIGWHEVTLLDEAAEDPVIGALPPRFTAFQWHSYEAPLPPGATALARSPVCLQAYRLGDAPAWGIQFHAEVTAEIVGWWLDDYRSDPDAIRVSIDPDALREQTLKRIDGWNRLGRELARRFLGAAGGVPGGPTPG